MKQTIFLSFCVFYLLACCSAYKQDDADFATVNDVPIPQEIAKWVMAEEAYQGEIPDEKGLWKPIREILYAVPVSFTEGITANFTEEEAWKLAIPIEELTAPYVAARVEGKLPGEEDYKLKKLLWIGLKRNKEEYNPIAEKWFKKLGFETLRVVWLGFTGDISPSGEMGRLFDSDGGITKVLDGLAYSLAEFDFLAGNLEGAVTQSKKAYPKKYTFSVSEETLSGLSALGFDWLSISNNHSWDFYAEGFIETLEALRKYAIDTSGAGKNIKDAKRWAEYTLGNSKIRIIGVSAYLRENSGFDGKTLTMAGESKAGVIWTDSEAIEDAISPREGLDIVFIHGGLEYTDKPRSDWVKLYRSIIDRGADIVIASHPHVIQGAEAYNGGYIFYSLGNFLFPDDVDDIRAFMGFILKLGIYDNKVIAVDCIPFISDGISLSPAGEKIGKEIIKRFKTLSEEL
ncbi:CapA family protein [Spirochaetia bacterium 38H-sp]|uniref:CapA family protein n=1 Tax=Rarispira pelagica TaxID=3141764 RepID=A0ABU9UEJ7_9SPIR